MYIVTSHLTEYSAAWYITVPNNLSRSEGPVTTWAVVTYKVTDERNWGIPCSSKFLPLQHCTVNSINCKEAQTNGLAHSSKLLHSY